MLDLADQPVNILPGLFAKGRAYDLDHLAGRDGSDRPALAQGQAVAEPRHEACSVEITRTGRIDALCRSHDAYVYGLVAPLDHRTLGADLHDGQLAHLRDGLQGIQRFGLAGEGLGFVLVGEDNIDMLADQPAEEFEILGHDVETGQVDGDLQPALLGRACGLEDQVVVLDQVALHVEAVVPVEDRRLDLLGRQLQGGAEVGDHRSLAVGGDQRHAFPRTLLAAEDDRFDSEVVQRLHEEVARGVGPDLADESHAAAQLRHGADRISGRASERKRVGESGDRFRDLGLEPGIHQAHGAFRQFEPPQYGVGFQIDQHVRESIADSDDAPDASVFGSFVEVHEVFLQGRTTRPVRSREFSPVRGRRGRFPCRA